MGNYTVYKHTCPNGKVYIGITKQQPEKRWKKKGQGYRKNKHFYSAILKYGWNNIKHDILFSNLTLEEASQKEIELISYYKSNQREYGYNRALGGRVNSGFTISKETRQKISKSLKGKSITYKRVVSEELKQRLRVANLGKKASPETREKISKSNKGKHRSETTKQLIREREQSKVENILQVDLNGNIINIFNSIHEASRKTNIDATKICAVCKGKRHYTKDFIWLYERDKHSIENRLNCIKKIPIKLLQLNDKGEIINEFSSLQECYEKTNLSKSAICTAIRKNTTSFGYKWKYLYEERNF